MGGKKKAEQKGSDGEERGMGMGPAVFQTGVLPYLTSALDDAAAVGDVCGKFKTYKTYKQTNFFPRRS